MRSRVLLITLVALFGTLMSCLTVPAVKAQQPAKPPVQAADDVVRITTELVQTDLTVLDKRGRFVEGLRPEQFELTLDGKPQAISFFEFIRTGSAHEAGQLAGAGGARSGIQPVNAKAEGDQRRVIFFFLDDLHLSGASLIRARKALTEFVNTQMGQNDQVAIVSTSGQIGFLQQLTDYKPMLHAAIERLAYRKNPETYAGKVPISDYEATRVEDHNDRELFRYLVLATMNEFQAKGALRRVAMNIVKNRVRQISATSKMVTNEMLGVLESMMRSSNSLPGRKLVFFMSDGFITDVRGSNAMTLLKRVTDTAARSGIVVYTMDARGTFNDPMVDAGRNDFPDGLASGTQAKVPSFENAVTQEPLHILADDTGGRAIINSNSFADAFQQAIDETSAYYLLAWRPDNDEERSGKARIKVTVKDHPDLRVRLRRNYYAPTRTAAKVVTETDDSKAAHPAAKTPEAELVTALGALYPQRTLATALSVGYVNTPDQGLVLKASMQLDRSSLDLAPTAAKSEVDVVGAAVDDRGVIVTFKQVLTVLSETSSVNQPVVWHQQLRLPPGLYQVRVALRERGSGRTGSAHQWIEVPEPSGALQMSSLFLGERRAASGGTAGSAPQPVMVDVERRFASTSVLRFQTYIYNAGGPGQPANVEIQARVVRDGHAVVTMPAAPLPADANDPARRPYWAELSLGQLPPGRYALQVTATDGATRVSASQNVTFVVE